MVLLMPETVPQIVWIVMPILIATGAALVTAALMQARAEVAISRQRETLAEARVLLATQHRAMEERVRAVEATRRKALDEFMAELRVEERQYLRETPTLLSRRKSLVVRERLCFRNVPLTSWVEHEYSGLTQLADATRPAPEPQVVLVEAREAAGEHKLLK
jgi:serine/threonine-protein kinase RIO1